MKNHTMTEADHAEFLRQANEQFVDRVEYERVKNELEIEQLKVAQMEPVAAFGHQCIQDQCENAYVEQTVHKQVREERDAFAAALANGGHVKIKTKVICDCVDANGVVWPDCSCNHGWREVETLRPIDPTAVLAAHDAKVRAEERKKVLEEAAEYCNSRAFMVNRGPEQIYLEIERELRRMAGEVKP